MEKNVWGKYKIINERINKEIEEFYLVNSVFLIVNSGLLAAFNFLDKGVLNFLLGCLGIIISILWSIGLSVQYKYRSKWIERAKRLESEQEGEKIWTNAPYICPSLMWLFKSLPIIFIVVWVLFTVLMNIDC